MTTFELFYSNVKKISDELFDKKPKHKIEAENIQSAINLFVEKYPDDGFPLIGISYGLSGNKQFAENPNFNKSSKTYTCHYTNVDGTSRIGEYRKIDARTILEAAEKLKVLISDGIAVRLRGRPYFMHMFI